MSNPVVSVDNVVPVPPDPTVIRKNFTRIVYDSQRFFTYGQNEYSDAMTLFDPTGKGERLFMTIPMSCVLSPTGEYDVGSVQPDFVSDEAWDAVRASPSCFVTSTFSIMPKIIVPSDILVENGVYSNSTPSGGNLSAYYWTGAAKQNLFNWDIIQVNGAAFDATTANYYKHVNEGSWTGIKYVSFKSKNDREPLNSMVVRLSNPPSPRPLGSDHNWLMGDSSDLVGGGAFCLLLNVIPSRGLSTSAENAEKSAWEIRFEFGDVQMLMSAAGEMKARITSGDAGGNWTTINLVEGKAKGGPPQQEQVDDRNPYIILVYPTWNGVIVASGVQEGRTNAFSVTPVLATSTHVKKIKEASILMEPWSSGFDPTAPADINVLTAAGDPEDVTVDFGTSITIQTKSCMLDLAYLPCFFSKIGAFDEWFVSPDDSSDIGYVYDVYSIWTNNDTAYSLAAPTVTDTVFVGPLSDTHYNYIKWKMENADFARVSGQLFGSILEVQETNRVPIKNGNGAFVLNWSGGSPGDDSATDWKKYIQSVSITVGLDGSSGSITVDKYGPAGQDAEAVQSIGGITLSASGGYGTVAGTIFEGLAMGVGRSNTAQGATWTIPLVGLEKKLDDIALINVPFFDGETLSSALDFLSKYAGILHDMTAANPAVQLSVSTDINVARFDWKSGTTVRAALDEVMNDVNHHYVVRDHMIYYYRLGANGLPFTLGPDWGSGYPGTKMVQDDQLPDFDDLHNEIVILGLEVMLDGQGTKIEGAPDALRIDRRSSGTVPDVPWSKTFVEGIPGYTTLPELADYASNRQSQMLTYESIGRTTIPGNASIKPYDRFNGSVIFSVTHNIDLQGKSWTTDLEFMDA